MEWFHVLVITTAIQVRVFFDWFSFLNDFVVGYTRVGASQTTCKSIDDIIVCDQEKPTCE